jgi:hypothetical protein
MYYSTSKPRFSSAIRNSLEITAVVAAVTLPCWFVRTPGEAGAARPPTAACCGASACCPICDIDINYQAWCASVSTTTQGAKTKKRPQDQVSRSPGVLQYGIARGPREHNLLQQSPARRFVHAFVALQEHRQRPYHRQTRDRVAPDRGACKWCLSTTPSPPSHPLQVIKQCCDTGAQHWAPNNDTQRRRAPICGRWEHRSLAAGAAGS